MFSYVLFVRKNALQILIPKFGLEGTVYLNSLKDDQKKLPGGVVFNFNEEVCGLINEYLSMCCDICL